MHTICFLLWHSLMGRHSQRNWNESSGCLRAYVCVCVLSKCLLCVSFQPNPRKIIKCMKAKTIRIFMLIYAFNEMIQHNWKKKESRFMYILLKNDWFRWIWCLQGIFSYIGWLCIMTSFTILFCLWTFVITFIHHFSWMVLVLI